MPKREKFTNLEYRPFKALVVGSSPTQPILFCLTSKVCGAAMEGHSAGGGARSIRKSHSRISCCLLLFFGLLLADSADLTTV
jgi:hypothetical protein